MYPNETTLIYSNMTARKSRMEEIQKVVVFGSQYLVKRYLLEDFDENFFQQDLNEVMRIYKRRINNYLGPDAIKFDHIEALWKLGYLPIELKSLPEGTLCPMRVPFLTIKNTEDEFFWLTNMLETLISCVIWPMVNSATIAWEFRKEFERAAAKTGAAREFIPWQGHDFSMRGMMGPEAAKMSGAAHLLSFTGTDTVPALDLLEDYYGADCEKELIGGSVAATEHSVMSMGLKDGELATFRRLITEVVSKGIISIVSDTWDFWKVLTRYLPALKDTILARNGKVVIRPDSGDPVKIICGDPEAREEHIRKGAVQILYEVFGGVVNKAGYIEVDPHIGLIYGDSINLERQHEILERLAAKGFASSNVVLGIGSYTYQYQTRDTFGQAIKATYGEVVVDGVRVGQEIYKDPKTDDGTKKSAKGLLSVVNRMDGGLVVEESCSLAEERCGLLRTIFLNSGMKNQDTLANIRARLASNL